MHECNYAMNAMDETYWS